MRSNPTTSFPQFPSLDSLFQSAAVVIPAYNANDSLPQLFKRLQPFVEARQIFVVDDGSSDATAEVSSRAGARVCRHDKNLGKGRALQTGFEAIRNTDFGFVVTMDADLQHQPEDLPSFFEIQRITKADIVLGRRPRLRTNMPLHRVLSNTVTSRLVSMRTGLAIQDSQCGFRLMRRNVIDSVSLQSAGFEAETEFLIKAAKLGFTIGSVPVQTVYTNEKSSMSHWATTVGFVKVLLRDY